MKRPAIFFDRDNTLIVSDGYLGDPEKVALIDGAATAIARARAMGFATVVISNQSGVARGMFDEAAVDAVNRKIDEKLRFINAAAVIDRHEFCPYHPEATVDEYRQDSDLRKPKPGMIHAAAQALALDLGRSWVIGDAPRDIEAGKAAGCRTVLLKIPELSTSPAAHEKLTVAPDHVAPSLKDAMDFIQEHAAAIPLPEPAAETNNSAAPEPEPPRPSRLESLAELMLMELRKRNEHREFTDFSVSKLMAGIVQVIALAVLFVAYLNRTGENFWPLMATAIFLQLFTIALLIMGRQK
jgi:D-glycero-D-manno-heptose 1,7-bisphosphate phosphatase